MNLNKKDLRRRYREIKKLLDEMESTIKKANNLPWYAIPIICSKIERKIYLLRDIVLKQTNAGQEDSSILTE